MAHAPLAVTVVRFEAMPASTRLPAFQSVERCAREDVHFLGGIVVAKLALAADGYNEAKLGA